jgi:hypothetical protein
MAMGVKRALVPFRSQTLPDVRGLEHLVDIDPDVLPIAPQRWEEMHRWLPLFQRSKRETLGALLSKPFPLRLPVDGAEKTTWKGDPK